MAHLITLLKTIKVSGACSLCNHFESNELTKGALALLLESSNTYLGICYECGHSISLSEKGVRDLNKAEVKELSDHPDFKQARERINDMLNAKNFWGYR